MAEQAPKPGDRLVSNLHIRPGVGGRLETPMRCKTPFPCLLLLPAILAPSGFPAAADEIETLVVTAHRLPAKDPVLPVTRLEPSLGNALGADVLRRLPNLAVSQSGSFGGVTQVRLRGAEANHALVLIDGIEVNDPANGSEYNFTHLTTFAAGAIEFLPGAQSALWGSDALAGVIHLSTLPNGPVRALSVEGGSFASYRAGIQLADRSERGHYNLAAFAADTNGVNISRSGGERDGYEHLSWQAGGGWAGEGWRLAGLLRQSRTESEYDPSSFIDFLPTDGGGQAEHDELLAGLTAELEGEHWRHQFKLNHLATDNPDRSAAGEATATEGRRFKAAYSVGYRFSPAHETLAFVEREAERFAQEGAASPFGDPNQKQRLKAASVGLEHIGRVGERLAWSASLRRDGNSDFKDVLTHRIALRYRASGRTELWLNYGEGIKNPSFFERFGYTPDTFIGNPDLRPETNEHLSVGARTAIGPAVLGLTLFRDRLKNEIDGFHFDPALGGFTAVNQEGRSRRQGVELTAAAQFGNANLSAGWGYVDAKEADDGREIRRPKHSGHLSAAYERGSWRLQAAAHLVGRQQDFSFASFPAQRVPLRGHQLLRTAAAFKATANLELSLRLENLLNENYEEVLGYQTPGRAAYFGVKLGW